MVNIYNFITNINWEIIIKTMKIMLIAIMSFNTNFRIINKDIKGNLKFVCCILFIVIGVPIAIIFKYKISFLVEIIFLIALVSTVFSFYNAKNSITLTIVSISINYCISFLAVIIDFILSKMFKINNDFLNFFVISVCHIFIWFFVIKIKRFRYGIAFFRNNAQNEKIDILVVNIGVLVLSSIILIELRDVQLVMKIVPVIFINIVSMCITIKESLQLYYKQKLLINDLNETKDELAARNKEIEKLENENLNFSKISHSLAHKQKSLEHKIDELLLNSEIAGEIDVRDRLEEISKKLYKTPIVKLDKTGITQVDDMLNVMQSECIKNNIEFDLQIIGNVYHIINNIVTVDELEILIADHVKDAIIAINHTDNVNRSILVRLGKIDECYGLYIHDSGIEFEKETLEKLGKEPITTHKSEGGTGMGFMNTFDTLKKCKGSLIINEIGKPSKDNFTKIVMIRFDGKNEFRVISYRENND